MGRAPRIHHPGAVFHLMSRGNGGQTVFLDDKDGRRFLQTLSTVKERNPFRLYAYCLMSNHFHLLVQVERDSVSLIMQHLLTRYSNYFNLRRKRTGHLFQGRFKSILCKDDAYMLQLLRYIHINPVKAGLVQDPKDWPWSGHKEYLAMSPRRLIDAGFPLSLFEEAPIAAMTSYARFVGDGLRDSGDAMPLPPPPDDEQAAPSPEISSTAEAAPNPSAIGAAVAAETGVPLHEILGPSRRKRVYSARNLLISTCAARGIRPSVIARFIGRNPSIVSRKLNG